MPLKQIQKKATSQILTDLQAISSKVNSFAWSDAGDPQVDFTSEPNDTEKAQVKSYFESGDHRKWVDL